VADHRLDSGSAPHLAADRLGDAPYLAVDPDPEPVRVVTAAISLVDVDTRRASTPVSVCRSATTGPGTLTNAQNLSKSFRINGAGHQERDIANLACL